MSKQHKSRLIKEFDEKHLNVLAMDYGLELEGTVGPNENEVRYIVKQTPYKTISYWPSADKIHISNKNKWIPNGLKWLYDYAKKQKR